MLAVLVFPNCKVFTLALLNKKFCPILRVLAAVVPMLALASLDLNARVSLQNLVKLGLLKLAKLLKVNEGEKQGYHLSY